MARSKIEWLRDLITGKQGYTINPVKGLCPMHCKNLVGYEYCYAAGERGLYKRSKWNPEIRYEPEQMLDLALMKEGERVFIGSTIELFHNSIPYEWLEEIFWFVKRSPWATCIFLTKQPQNLIKWSPFPDNCWIGVSAIDDAMFTHAVVGLDYIEARVKFVSLEPLLNWGMTKADLDKTIFKYTGMKEERSAFRAITPSGFAKAFYEANK